MSVKKSLKLLLHVSNIVLKIALIYLVAGYAYRTLSDEDEFYQKRGINNFCQSDLTFLHSPIDEDVCKQHKYKKFVYLYIDSLPFDLFEYDNQFTGTHSKSFTIKHFGITDSGPVFSSFATGKISNKYEGSIANIDNIFQQFKNASYQIKGFGYFYPIYEMIGESFFSSYENTKHGLNKAFCSDFIDLNDVIIEGLSITESLIFDQVEYYDYFNKRYHHFKRILKAKRHIIFDCLAQQFENSMSYFLYEVYTDTIGHQFSRQSKFYLNKVAALKANLDIFIQFIRDNQEETLLLILSDHGVVHNLWETEISNHGIQENGNESFLYIFNRKIGKNMFDELSTLNSYDIVTVFAQLIQNINYPINYRYMPKMIWQSFTDKIFALRQKEVQILLYMKSFPEEVLSRFGINLDKLAKSEALGQVEKLLEIKSFEEQSVAPLVFDKYYQHIENLNALYNILLKTQVSDNWLPSLILHYSIIFFFVLISFFLLWNKMKTQSKRLAIAIGLFISLLLIFYIMGRVSEGMFVGYNFLLLSFCLLLLNLRAIHFELSEEFKSKITILMIMHLVLFAFDFVVEKNSFFFFYYQNIFLQTILCILFFVWSLLFLKQFLNSNKTGFFNRQIRFAFILFYFICDLAIFVYELKLMFSLTYFQNQFMIIISRLFYTSFVILVLLHFNFFHKREQISFVLVLKLIFWFGHNYIRFAYYGIILPGYYFYLQYHKNAKMKDLTNSKENRLLRKVLDYGLILYHTLFVFYITRGRLDTNISVRVGNRNWGAHIEEIPIFTAIIFALNKFLPFIVSYFLMLLMSKKLKDLKPKLRSLTKTFNCHLSTIGVRLSDIWFGGVILIYLSNFDNPETQRSSFMLYSSGLILVIIFYTFAVIDSIISLVKNQVKRKYEAIPSSN